MLTLPGAAQQRDPGPEEAFGGNGTARVTRPYTFARAAEVGGGAAQPTWWPSIGCLQRGSWVQTGGSETRWAACRRRRRYPGARGT